MKLYVKASDVSAKRELLGSAPGSDKKNSIYSFGNHNNFKLPNGVSFELGNSIATLNASSGEINIALYGWISYKHTVLKISKYTAEEFSKLYDDIKNMSGEELTEFFKR